MHHHIPILEKVHTKAGGKTEGRRHSKDCQIVNGPQATGLSALAQEICQGRNGASWPQLEEKLYEPKFLFTRRNTVVSHGSVLGPNDPMPLPSETILRTQSMDTMGGGGGIGGGDEKSCWGATDIIVRTRDELQATYHRALTDSLKLETSSNPAMDYLVRQKGGGGGGGHWAVAQMRARFMLQEVIGFWCLCCPSWVDNDCESLGQGRRGGWGQVDPSPNKRKKGHGSLAVEEMAVRKATSRHKLVSIRRTLRRSERMGLRLDESSYRGCLATCIRGSDPDTAEYGHYETG
jgi:hypothetical protein